MGLDNGGLMCSETGGFPPSSLVYSDAETKHKWYGSGFLKQERSWTGAEDDSRDLKVGKIGADDFSASKAMLPQQRAALMRSNSNNFLPEGQQMLSFSSPNSQTVTLPYYHPSSIAFARNAGT